MGETKRNFKGRAKRVVQSHEKKKKAGEEGWVKRLDTKNSSLSCGGRGILKRGETDARPWY